MLNKKTPGEKTFDVFNIVFLIIISFIMVYPLYFVLCASISDPYMVKASGALLLYPKGINFGAYPLVFKNPQIATGYLNTLFYTGVGTTLNVVLTILAAYVITRKHMYGKGLFMFMIVFTMFFSGGLIPGYLNVKNFGLLDTRWALIIPNAMAAFNVIITKTFFQTIPDSLEESASIDGANDFTILFKIMVPLAMPVIAVNILFYSVGHWNSWFNAFIYLQDSNLFPLQLFLRMILVQGNVQDMANLSFDPIADNIKYAVIIVSTLPVMCVYPFLQKYFVKGVMIGALKG